MSDQEKDLELSEFGRRLAGARKLVEGQCEYCDAPFKGIIRRRFCSDAHRVAYYRAKKAKEGQKAQKKES